MPTDSTGSWIVTYTGKKFYPLDPKPIDIDPIDIAVSLSRTVRWRGFTRLPYSVAQHSVWVVNFLQRQGADLDTLRWGLMHDAAEAYIGDLPRPVKQQIPEFKEIEDRILLAVAQRFGLKDIDMEKVQNVDDHMLVTEAAQLLTRNPENWDLKYEYQPLWLIKIEPVSAQRAYSLWMDRYVHLFFLH